MKILFWINKVRTSRNGEAPVMMRLTHKGIRQNITLDLKVNPNLWDSKKQKVKGNNETSDTANNLIRTFQNRATEALAKVLREKDDYTLEDIIQQFKGEDIKDVGFVEFFDKYLINMEARLGVDFTQATIDKYRYSKGNLILFLSERLSRTDIPLRHVTNKTVADFNQYLRGEKRFNNNHVNKTLEQIRKVYKTAVAYGLVQNNPFDLITFKKTETYKEYLTLDELRHLLSYEPRSIRMLETKDIFLFLCFTGLAHADAYKATIHDVKVGVDNKPWLMFKRTKTKTPISIPILPIVSHLIEKYSGHPKCFKDAKLMPIPTNQVLNRALKLLAKEAGISKKLCSHSGRYTFASTVLLSNGVRVEVAQKLLAHNSIKSTMIYAKLSTTAIAGEVGQLSSVLDNILENSQNKRNTV